MLFELRFPATQISLSQYEPLKKIEEERRRGPATVETTPAADAAPTSAPESITSEAVQRRPAKTNIARSPSGQIFEANKDAEMESLRLRVRQSFTSHMGQFYEADGMTVPGLGQLIIHDVSVPPALFSAFKFWLILLPSFPQR